MNWKQYIIHTGLTKYKWVADFREVVAETKSWLLEKLFGDVYVGYKVMSNYYTYSYIVFIL